MSQIENHLTEVSGIETKLIWKMSALGLDWHNQAARTQLASECEVFGPAAAWAAYAANDAVMPIAKSDMPTAEQKPAAATAVKPEVPIGRLFQQENAPAAKPAETRPGLAVPPADSSIAKRLQTLQQLFNQKLIDESEYKQQKQRILNEL